MLKASLIRCAVLSIIASTCFVVTHAQSQPAVQWRDVSLAELAMDKPIVDKDADAEAIFWEVRLDDKNRKRLFYEHYVRIKIFTERGRESYSKIDIKYNDKTRVDGVAARVIKPDGSIQQISASDIFEQDIITSREIKIKSKSFAVPGIEPGVIVEYQYREGFKGDSLTGERLIFQRDIPIQKITYRIRPYKESFIRVTYFNTPDLELEPDPTEEGFQMTSMTNVPAFEEEPFMAPEDTIRPWAYLEYSGSVASWSRLGIGMSRAFNSLTEPDKRIRKKAEELIAGAATDKEKTRRIYNFVRTNIRNLSYDESSRNSGLKTKFKKASDILKRGYGYASQIDLLFASLLRAAGKAPSLVVSPNRSNYFFNPNQPTSHYQFLNPSSISVLIDGERMYFNPSAPFLPFGELVWYEENVHVMLANSNGYRWNTVPMKKPEESTTTRTGKFVLDENGTLSGTVTKEVSGYRAADQRRTHFSDSDAKRLEELEEEVKEDFSTATVSDMKILDFDKPENTLKKSYTISVPDYTQKTGSRMFFQPGIFEAKSKPLFTSATRKHPIYFKYPWREIDEIEIKLPDSFAVEKFSVPVDVHEKLKLAGCDYSLMYNKDTHTLIYKREYFFGGNKKILFPASSYTALKTLFDSFNKSDTHSLALKRKAE